MADPVISVEEHLIILAMNFNPLKINISQIEEPLLPRDTDNPSSL